MMFFKISAILSNGTNYVVKDSTSLKRFHPIWIKSSKFKLQSKLNKLSSIFDYYEGLNSLDFSKRAPEK